MAEAMDASAGHDDWDQFFRLDNQEHLLDTISTKEPPVLQTQGEQETSPQLPSLEFSAHSTGSSSPSEIEHFSNQLSPVYQLPARMESSPTRPNPKKRKNVDGTARPATQRQPRGQKISHNVIEKRYRSNLNDKIARLRDSVPELRTATPTVKRRPAAKAPGSDSDGSGDEDHGLKFNKATVLTKATEYIQQLERQNQKLATELSMFRNRTGPVEKLRNPPAISTSVMMDVASASTTSARVPSTTASTDASSDKPSPTETAVTSPGLIRVPDEVRRLREEAKPEKHYAGSLPAGVADGPDQPDPFSQPVHGMIPVPESFRRLREEAAAQDHFAPESSYYRSLGHEEEVLIEEDDEERSNWPRSKTLSRALIGSLAGLMVMEGFSEKEEDLPGDMEKRGLFALPSELLTESRGFRAQIRGRIISFAASTGPRKALPFVLGALVLAMVCVIVFSLLVPQRRGSGKSMTVAAAAAVASLPSSQSASASLLRSPGAVPNTDSHLAPPSTSASSSTPSSKLHPASSGEVMHRTYSPPPDAFLDRDSGASWDLQLIDRLAMEWFGVTLPTRGVDEEAARRHTTPRRDLKALRTIVQRLFLQGSA